MFDMRVEVGLPPPVCIIRPLCIMRFYVLMFWLQLACGVGMLPTIQTRLLQTVIFLLGCRESLFGRVYRQRGGGLPPREMRKTRLAFHAQVRPGPPPTIQSIPSFPSVCPCHRTCETSVPSGKAARRTGVCFDSRPPRPSCPQSPLPHTYRSPPFDAARQWLAPARTWIFR